jgi:hypothetical protein
MTGRKAAFTKATGTSMSSRVRSKREQRDALTCRLRGEGMTWPQVAARIQAAEHVNKRVAMRLARGLAQWQVARAWNERWPAGDGGPGITDQHISYWETWPHSGREPSAGTLCRLAVIYECGVDDLIDQEHYIPPGGPVPAESPAAAPPGAMCADGALRPCFPGGHAGMGIAAARAGTAGVAGARRTEVPGPQNAAYRRTEGSAGDSSAGYEVVMAAHEGSDHAESAERRDIGDATLEQIHADVSRLSRDYMTGEPFTLFQEMRRVRGRVYAALDRRLWPRDQTDLYFMLGCLNCLMANAASDLGSGTAAEELARAAWAYATAIGHRPLMAQLRCSFTDIAYWRNQSRQARELARNGLDYLPDGPTGAQLHLKFGRATARLGDADGARQAIVAARAAAQREYGDDLLEIGGEFRLSLASQHSLAGSVLIEIPGAEDDAAGELERAADLYAAGPEPGESYRYTLEVRARIDLATARLRGGQLDAAAAAVAAALSLPAAKRTVELPQRFRAVRVELARPRYQGSAQGSELDEQIEEFCANTIMSGQGPLSAP